MGAVGAATLATAALAGAAAAPAQAEPRGAVVTSSSAAPTQEQIDAQSERSVVQLAIGYEAYVDYPDANGDWYRSSEPVQVAFSCTGWFVDTTGDIVTAGHCVDPKDPEVKTALVDEFLQEQDITDSDTAAWAEKTFTLENSSGDAQPEQTVLAYQSPDVDGAVLTSANGTVAHVQAFKPFDDEDLALLNVVTKKQTPALPVAASTPDVGAPVTSIGFPGAASGGAGAQQASFKTGTISSRQVLPSGVARLEVNADIGQGMSGGPTIDANGAVVGVNSALNGDGHGDFNWITDTDSLRRFLSLQGVTVKQADARTEPSPSASPSASRTGTGSPAGAGSGTHDSTSPAASVNAIPVGFVVLAVAALVSLLLIGAVIAVIVLVVRSRQRRKQSLAREAVHQAGPDWARVPPTVPTGGAYVQE